MKTRIFNYLVVIATTLLFNPTASATWGTSFRSLGKTPTLGEPQCVDAGAKEVVCIAEDQQRELMVNEFSNNAWSGWADLAGGPASNPSCVNDGNGNVVCGVKSAANTLAVTVFDGTSWSSFVDSNGQIFSDLSCSLLRKGAVFCASRNLAGALTAALFNTTTSKWGKFINASGATITSAPGCAGDNDRDVICAMGGLVNGLNTVVVNRFDGARWEGFLNINSSFSASANPSCTSLGIKGEVMCFHRSLNTAFWANQFKSGLWQNSNWTGWHQITGSESSPRVSCALLSGASGSLACGIRSLNDSFLYAGTFDGSNWSSFDVIGTKPIWSGPGCAALGGGKAICVVVGINNQAGSVTGP